MKRMQSGPVGLFGWLIVLCGVLCGKQAAYAGNGLPAPTDDAAQHTRAWQPYTPGRLAAEPITALQHHAAPLSASAAGEGPTVPAGASPAVLAERSDATQHACQAAEDDPQTKRRKLWPTLRLVLFSFLLLLGVTLLKSIIIGLPAASFGPLLLTSLAVVGATAIGTLIFIGIISLLFSGDSVDGWTGILLVLLVFIPLGVALTIGLGGLSYYWFYYWIMGELLTYGLAYFLWVALLLPLIVYIGSRFL